MKKPLVTVLIDTYNHENFIEQAILSVLEQDMELKDVEILVIDDGSLDNTPNIVKKFAPKVGYLRKENGGQASAFNVGIPEAKGDIIAFLDGDDWWHNQKLPTVLNVLENNPEVGAVGHSIIEIYGDGREHTVLPYQSLQLKIQDNYNALLFRRMRCLLGTSRFTARKTILEKVLPIPEGLVVEADEYMFTLSAILAHVIILETPLTYYRLHSGNLYQIQDRDIIKIWRKYQVLEVLLKNLPIKLAEYGLAKEIIEILMQPIFVEAERYRLSLKGGMPWDTFKVERTANKMLDNGRYSLNDKLFRNLIYGLALLTPPQWFYKLKRAHAQAKKILAQEPLPKVRQTVLRIKDN